MRKLVREMTVEEHEAFKKDLQEKKNLIRSMSAEERAEYERRRNRNWSDDYIKRAYSTVNFRTPKGGKDLIKSFAESQGLTMNDFLRKMVYEGMVNAGFEFDPALLFPPAVMPENVSYPDADRIGT